MLILTLFLFQAQAEQDYDFVKNTKGFMFLSTPHLGTSVAKLNYTTKFLFFPSTEVCDLEEDSPQLVDLNQNFVQLAKDRGDLKIVSLGESLPTPMLLEAPESCTKDFNLLSTKIKSICVGFQ